MQFKNEIMLITYADSLGGSMKALGEILQKHYGGAVGGLHLLPFYPSSADRGFAPIRYDQVDPSLGSWEDVKSLGETYYLMFDFMINHISSQSPYFRDMIEKKEASPWWDFFVHYNDFWPEGGPTVRQLEMIYKRKARAPYTEAEFSDGTKEKLWCTFSQEQIDLNVKADITKRFIRETIASLADRSMTLLRLDAFAYAVKKADTRCFFVEPEIWDLLDDVRQEAGKYGITLLPEIHEHYTIHQRLSQKGYWVYDFALPMLTLYTLLCADAGPLRHWLSICPRNQFTTLDTHDGIGVVDVRDLLSEKQVEKTRELLYQKGANASRVYSTEKYNNLDVYQINCTYYSALGDDDRAYLLARAIQFFAPGIPQVYYVGMLAGSNDLELVERTRQGRDINRHFYTADEIGREMERPVVRALKRLMVLRNTCEAFSGDLVSEDTSPDKLSLRRSCRGAEARLDADLPTRFFTVTYRQAGGAWQDVELL